MADFTARHGADGVSVITWDVPGRSMNVLSREGLGELGALVEAGLADPAVRGLVLTSAKADFAGGMDLAELARMSEAGGAEPARGLFEGVMAMHRVLRRIERAGMDPKTLRGGKPIATALPGTAVGIGLELPLATHRIFAAPNPRAKIGLPEILVGLFPGAGGTTRLVRKLGVMAAAPFLLEGRLLDPERAKAAGLIDEIAEDPVAAARAWVLGAAEADLVKPWDRKDYKMPGGGPYHPAGFMTFVGASAMVQARTMGAFPAPKALLSAVYEGALVPFDTALEIEARWFTQVLADPASGAMIRSLFLNKEALEKGARRPAGPARKVARLGVVGAGMMGAGIALVAAQAGIEVVLLDATEEAAARGKAYSERHLDAGLAKRRITAETRAAVLGRIAPTADHAALAGADLVIEAVFEDPQVKADVIARIEAATGPQTILASNTSTLPIAQLAGAAARPAQVLGIHFFSPVEKMGLVEIIRGPQTGPEAVALALDFVRQIRKTPIVVNDARFFYANRCIIPYLNEGIRMLAEGVAPALVETAARMAGMPLGPLQLVDETSITLGLRIAAATRAAMGAAYPDAAVDAVLERMGQDGRLGRKAGAGFYDYDAGGARLGLSPALAAAWPPAAAQPQPGEVQDRLLMIQALEAVRAFEAGVLEDIREGDVGAILGWGFAPWSGGPFAWLDRLGAARAVALAEGLAARHGPRFAPPALLRDLAATGESFYGRYGAGARAA